jgi:hypothetical protein
MNSTLVKPQKIYESAEVREYSLAQSLIKPTKESKFQSLFDIAARVMLFYAAWSIAVNAGIYIWRLLACPC